MDSKVKQILKEYIGINPKYSSLNYEVFIVWKCKVLQNAKWLLCTNLPDDKYYELTYNGDKNELYIDEYDKKNNCMIKKPFVSCKVQPDDLADMISSMSSQEQIMVLDAMDQNVVQHWYKQRFKLI